MERNEVKKMDIKKRFTCWYVRQGYKFGYRDITIPYFICPIWVRPLLPFLFSPSIYCMESNNKNWLWIKEGMQKIIKEMDKANNSTKNMITALDYFSRKEEGDDIAP